MNWTEEELVLAMALYCQLPFGKMHARNPTIIRLAERIGRTPSAVAMKLVNFASLDPEIVNSGRSGLGNASAKDRMVWAKFQNNWENELIKATKELDISFQEDIEAVEQPVTIAVTSRKAEIEIRTKQSLFRRMVLSSYTGACCMSGLSDKRLLVASHIIPWNKNNENRLNPRNGLCLSALHDRAFDRGLITVLPDMTIVVSSEIKKLHHDKFIQLTLVAINGNKIIPPEKFRPSPEFLEWHNENIFLS